MRKLKEVMRLRFELHLGYQQIGRCVWQVILAHFGSLFWPTLSTNGYSWSGADPERRNSLDWRAMVELFEEIRREYEFGIGTIAGVAKKLKEHRRMVREAIGSALPTPRKKTERPRWKLAGAVAFVDGILELDR